MGRTWSHRPLRRLRRHLPMNGEDLVSPAPPAAPPPPPHEWGGPGLTSPLRRLRHHLPMNGEDLVSPAPPAAAPPPPHEMGRTYVRRLLGWRASVRAPRPRHGASPVWTHSRPCPPRGIAPARQRPRPRSSR